MGEKVYEICSHEIPDASALSDALQEIVDMAQTILEADLPRDRR